MAKRVGWIKVTKSLQIRDDDILFCDGINYYVKREESDGKKDNTHYPSR